MVLRGAKGMKEGSVRLAWTEGNWTVQRYTKILDKKTKETRLDWEDWGYYGSNLKLAALCAVEAGCDRAEVKDIPDRIEQAVKEIKACLKELS